MYKVTYVVKFNQNLAFSSTDSELIKIMEQRQNDSLFLTTSFYRYDGDGMVGYVNGEVSMESRE